MKMPSFVFVLMLLSICGVSILRAQEANPPAAGFNAVDSDPSAIAIADEVMQAMGGRKAWDETRYIAWTFFGRRQLLWDKYTGNVRIDIPADSSVFLVNVHSRTGKVLLKGQELTHPDSIAKYVDRAESIWINDSYWLVMPFKLKDSGVTLKYLGAGATSDGQEADVLQLTFEGVGKTPENKYHVYVGKAPRLVIQWDYYQKFTDEKPQISNPWADYRNYGHILLSGERGRGKLTQIGVYEEVPESFFKDFKPVDWTLCR